MTTRLDDNPGGQGPAGPDTDGPADPAGPPAGAGPPRGEERFRQLVEMLPETVFESDITARLTFANRQAFKTFGFSPRDFARGVSGYMLLAPEDRPRAFDYMASVAGGGPGEGVEFTALRKDGGVFPIMMYASPIVRQDEVVGFRGIVVDISGLKQAQEALRRSEEKYRLVVQNASEGLLVSVDLRFAFVNPKAEAILGHAAEALLGMTYRDVIHPDDLPAVVEISRQRARMDPAQSGASHACRVLRGDGRTVWVEFSGVPIDWDGRQGWLNFVSDVTARRQAHEEALLRAKLQAAIETAGAACHELNQPLQSIVLMAELTLAQLPANDPLRPRMEKMRQEMRRMAAITHRLSGITVYRSRDYLGAHSRILDLEGAGQAVGPPGDEQA
ncbi:PAS domain S-box protein [Desulfarculus baarsii]